jgi:serine/threonine-protein kinase RsbW
VSKTIELKLPSRIESVDESAVFAEKVARDWGYGDDFLSAIDLAVRESVANAVKHGNKFDEDKQVEVVMTDSTEGLELCIRDHGEGFEVDEIPDPTNPENLLKINGRGILFMRSFMDEVGWERAVGGGMMVKMLKRR